MWKVKYTLILSQTIYVRILNKPINDIPMRLQNM